jgi:hypothetical protein
VAGGKDIAFALLRIGKSTEPPQLPEGRKFFSPSGQYLVGIALVAHIPNQSVPGGVKDTVEGNSEFNDSQIGCQMTATFGDHTDDFIADLLSQLWEILPIQGLHIIRSTHLVEQIYHAYPSPLIPAVPPERPEKNSILLEYPKFLLAGNSIGDNFRRNSEDNPYDRTRL